MSEGFNSWLSNNVHGHVEPTEPTNVGPWSRVVGTCGDHSCVVNRRGEFYDRVPVHGDTYIGKARSDRDAYCRWKNHLMTIGVTDVEGAKFHDS